MKPSTTKVEHWMRTDKSTTATTAKTTGVGNNMMAGGINTCAYFAACNHSGVACSDVASISSLNLDGATYENKFGIYWTLFNFLKVKIPTLFFWLQSMCESGKRCRIQLIRVCVCVCVHVLYFILSMCALIVSRNRVFTQINHTLGFFSFPLWDFASSLLVSFC